MRSVNHNHDVLGYGVFVLITIIVTAAAVAAAAGTVIATDRHNDKTPATIPVRVRRRR